MTGAVPRTVRSVRAGLATAVLMLAALVSHADAPGVPAVEVLHFNLERPDIAAFVQRLVERDHLPQAEVLAILGAAKPRPELVPAMTRPAEKTLAWWEYRARYVTAARVSTGAEFWRQHGPALDAVAQRFGVAPEYLIAILGIETNYGQVTGNYPEIDTLMTLAFDYPARDAYFRTELRQFLLLSRDLAVDPLALKGSYGGALGVPQLMPSSYRQFAASADARHKANLWTDWSLIFESVAEFLVKRGWERDGPVLADVVTAGGKPVADSGGIKLNETVDALRHRGVRVDRRIAGATRAVLIRAALKDRNQYRVGFSNFRVISRYNPRLNYAMAVCDLASEVRAAHALPAAAVSAPAVAPPATTPAKPPAADR